MLKAWDFTTNKLCHRYFENNLQKIFPTNILENGTGWIPLIAVLMVGLCLKFQTEIVDQNDSIFTCLSPLYISIRILRTVMYQLQRQVLDTAKHLRLIFCENS